MELDGKDMEKLRALLDGLDGPPRPADPRIRLLAALEPFLNDAQRQRLPTAMELVKFLIEREARNG